MNGRIEKRGKKYLVIVEMGRDVDGIRRRIVRTLESSTRAKAELRRIQNELDMGAKVGADKLPLSDFLRDWLEGRKGNLKPRTYESYKYHIEYHLIPALGKIPLGKLSPKDINDYINKALKTVTKRTAGKEEEQTLTLRSVDSHLTTLNMALRRAKGWKLITHNPMEGVERPKYESVKYQVLEPRQLLQFLDLAKKSSIYAIIMLIGHTGMRLGEALGLEWKDVDFKERTIFVHQQWQRTKEKGLCMGPPKSKKGTRYIPLTDAAAALLEGLYEKGKVYVFPGQGNVPRDPSAVDKAFARLRKRAGHEGLRIHDLRHSFASSLLANGVPLPEVQAVLGHEKASTTANIYAHALPSREKEVAIAFEKILKEAEETKK